MQEVRSMTEELARIQQNNRIYLLNMPYSTPVQSNKFTGKYWRVRNVLFYFLYRNGVISLLCEMTHIDTALQTMKRMHQEMNELASMKAYYGCVLPYPKEKNIEL